MPPPGTARGPLDRGGSCPQCGAPIAFRIGAASAQVCPYCRFVVVRTDRDLRALGRVADLVELASPLPVGSTGALAGRRFRIAGRAQYDRAGAPGAPWQELFVAWDDGAWSWLAEAQGRIWLTSVAAEGPSPVPFEQAAPGTPIRVPGGATLVVAERGHRRMISGEGELPFAIVPGAVERYLDLAGPAGACGTLDFGDGSGPPVLYLGTELDPAAIAVDPGAGGAEPAEPRTVRTESLACPGCGGAIPLVVPERAERVVCPYCRLQCDLSAGALVALKQLPEPPSRPDVPLGAKGRLRAHDVTCIAFLVRSCVVDEERFPWREYLLWDATASTFAWLVEEEGSWQLVQTLSAGDVTGGGSASCTYKGHAYAFEQSVEARVDHVLGEVYWRVEVGETVRATTWKDERGRTIGEEASADESVWTWGSPLAHDEVRRAFGLEKVAAPLASIVPRLVAAWAALLVGWVIVTLAAVMLHPGAVVWSKNLDVRALAAPGAPESAVFSEPFEIEKDERNLQIELSVPGLANGWIGGDVALVGDLDGTVTEAPLAVEYWSGTSGGESWSEGSRSDSAWFSRVRSGRYVLRFEPEWDPASPPPPPVQLVVRSDTWRGLYVALSFVGLVVWMSLASFVAVQRVRRPS